MAKSDVVKHDLTTLLQGAASLNIDKIDEPFPFPGDKKGLQAQEKLLVKPPITTLVSDEDRAKLPYCSVGRVGVLIGTKKLFGSGWVVAKRAFITAGHGVYISARGGWINQAQFAPRFNTKAGKVYDVKTVYSLKGWVENDESPYDMAACVVTEDFTEAEPPLKFEATLFAPKIITAIGYPNRPIPGHDFNGKRMWQSVGEFIKDAEDMWWAANNMSAGASGGPWCDPASKMIINGITANRPDGETDVVRSPDFFNGLDKLYKAVKDL